MKRFFYRHQPPMHVRSAVLAGAGAALTLSALGLMGFLTSGLWLIAPFGASCVLLFAAPSAVLSQPANLVGGHLVAAAIALVLVALAPDHIWFAAMAAGLTISAMVLLRIVHPPAGATALIAYFTHADWTFFFVPVLAGCLLLVAFAWGWHRIIGGTYPLDAPP